MEDTQSFAAGTNMRLPRRRLEHLNNIAEKMQCDPSVSTQTSWASRPWPARAVWRMGKSLIGDPDSRGILWTGVAVVAGVYYSFALPGTGSSPRSHRHDLVAGFIQRGRRTRQTMADLWAHLWKSSRHSALVVRVRGAVQRVVSNPQSITVHIDGNRVVLRGAVPDVERHELLTAVRRVNGVWVLVCQLQPAGAV